MYVIEVFTHAKQALNTQQPDEVVCRDKEITQIKNFLDIRVNKKNPGSLYISGAPGTGKTAVIKHLLEQEHLVSFIMPYRLKSVLVFANNNMLSFNQFKTESRCHI